MEVRADTCPKNLRVDVIHYRFALELQDQDDRISGTADVDLRFVGEGETSLRFDLVNRDNATGRGMTVSAVTADGASLAFTHRDNALTIALPRRLAHYQVVSNGFTLLYLEHAYGRAEFLEGLEASRQRVLEFDNRNPATGKEIWVAVHTRKDAGQLGNRILREAGVS